MSEDGEIYIAGKKFTLPPALTAWTNSTSGLHPVKPVWGNLFLAVNLEGSVKKGLTIELSLFL